MPPDLALSSTLIGSNYLCLELIFMVPNVFEPLKLDCTCFQNPWMSQEYLHIYIMNHPLDEVKYPGEQYLAHLDLLRTCSLVLDGLMSFFFSLKWS